MLTNIIMISQGNFKIFRLNTLGFGYNVEAASASRSLGLIGFELGLDLVTTPCTSTCILYTCSTIYLSYSFSLHL